jgi:hypothetical protein
MKRYNSEDYFSVINKNTGKKIADCAQQEDALLMVSFDPQNRIITRNKFLMGQVVDVVMPKALPTSEIVVNMDGGVGGSWRVETTTGNGPGLPQIKLPDRQKNHSRFNLNIHKSQTLMVPLHSFKDYLFNLQVTNKSQAKRMWRAI